MTDPDGAQDQKTIAATVTAFPSIPSIPLGDRHDTLDLDTYVEHPNYRDDQMTWTVEGYNPSLVSITIDPATHVVTFRAGDQVGTTQAVFTAADPDGKFASSTVTVTVTAAPMIVGLGGIMFFQDEGIQVDLSQYVEDADNSPGELLWNVSGGNNILSALNGGILTLSSVPGWTGTEELTFTVTDPDGAQDQKTIVVETIKTNAVSLGEHTTGDTLLYADVGDTLHLDVWISVGTKQADGVQILVTFDNRYLEPLDQEAKVGVQPFTWRLLPFQASILTNSVVDIPGTAFADLSYAALLGSNTFTGAGTVAELQFRVLHPIPAGESVLVTLESDSPGLCRNLYIVSDGSGDSFFLLPLNHIQIQNRPPGLLLPARLTTQEDSVLTVTLDNLVEDPEFSPTEMIWSVSVAEEGFQVQMIKVEDIQQLTVFPPAEWHGTTSITFRVTDPAGLSAWKNANFTVTPVNDPPVLSSMLKGGIDINEDETFAASLDTLVSDPDDATSTLAWSIESGKTIAAQINSDTGLLRILSPPDWNGQDTLFVAVSDPAGGSDQAPIRVDVRAVNDPPVFSSPLLQIQNVSQDTVLDLSPFIADADDSLSTLIWDVDGAQTLNARIENGGYLYLTLRAGWLSTEVLTVTVEDLQRSSTSATLHIDIVPSLDFDGDGMVSFADFVAFAQRFGAKQGDARYVARFDLDGDGEIGVTDYVKFQQVFSDH